MAYFCNYVMFLPELGIEATLVVADTHSIVTHQALRQPWLCAQKVGHVG